MQELVQITWDFSRSFSMPPASFSIADRKLNKFLHSEVNLLIQRFKLVWRCHQLLSGFLAKGHLLRVSRQSRQSLIIRVIMKWSRELCTDLLTFFYSWGKPQLVDRRMKGLCKQLLPQMGSLSSKLGWLYRTARLGGRRKERTGKGTRP